MVEMAPKETVDLVISLGAGKLIWKGMTHCEFEFEYLRVVTLCLDSGLELRYKNQYFVFFRASVLSETAGVFSEVSNKK